MQPLRVCVGHISFLFFDLYLSLSLLLFLQGDEAAAAGAAAANLQHLLLSPFFSLCSITLVVPALAGVRANPRYVAAAAAAAVTGGGQPGAAGAAAAATVEVAMRLLGLDDPLGMILALAGDSGEMYVHRDPARFLCSLAAAETQSSSTSSSSSNSNGSLLLHFERVSVFAILDGDMLVSPRSAAGVSDDFQDSAAARKLLQQAAAAAAAADGAATETAQALLPHRLPVELAPLNQ